MSIVLSKPPGLRRARRRDSIAEARMRYAEEQVRDPRKERQAMLRFLAYLKPYIPLFFFATLCGIANYMIGAFVPSVTGYVLDRILNNGGAAVQHGRTNPLYPVFDSLIRRFAPHTGPIGQVEMLLGNDL
jgi:hypothetical protein